MVRFIEASILSLLRSSERNLELKHIQDFLPISLISAPNKIISMVLSNRIRAILHKVIDGNRYAFDKGRQILDSILIANESVEDYKRRKVKGVVVNLF